MFASSDKGRGRVVRLGLVSFGLMLFCAASGAFRLSIPLAESATLTVSSSVLGKTTTYIGATEAGGFWSADLSDLGINTYRLWTKMAELEWWDDDDALDGQWDDSEYGTPTIAQIKGDSASGFANTIPWTWWDNRFDEIQSWRLGTQTRRGIIAALVQNGITPIVVLRVYDNQGQPEQRPGAVWAPRPPVTQEFRNEWWEHCFAVAYWLNVRNNYGVTHFQVLNEPDYNCQGWCNNSCSGFAASFCGTQADYVQLVQDAYDAVSYANSLAGRPTYVHAPVVANYNSAYVAYTLNNADPSVQVVDYHTYADDPRVSITGIRSTISSNNPDGVLEPIWVSEWGALWSSYNTFTRAMRTANQLLTFSEEEVEGITLFNMYDWSTTVGQDYGLVDLQSDGMGGVNRVYTESYYAYRLMTRGLVRGKERLSHTATGFLSETRTMITRDANYIYVIVLRNNGTQTAVVNVNLSALRGGGGTATVREYSGVNKDAVVETPTITNGQFSFTAPAVGISLARVDRIPTAVRLEQMTATAESEMPRATKEIWIVLGLLALGALGGGSVIASRIRKEH